MAKSIIVELKNGIKVKLVKESETVYSQYESVKTGYGTFFQNKRYYEKTADGKFVEISAETAKTLVDLSKNRQKTQNM